MRMFAAQPDSMRCRVSRAKAVAASLCSERTKRWPRVVHERGLLHNLRSSKSSSNTRTGSTPSRRAPLECGESSRRQLTKSDLVEQLLEASVGAERVGQGLDLEIDKAVDALQVGVVEQAECLVLLAQADVDGRLIDVRNKSSVPHGLKELERLARLLCITRQGLSMSVGHNQERLVTCDLPCGGEPGNRFRLHLFFTVGVPQPVVRQREIGADFYRTQSLLDRFVILARVTEHLGANSMTQRRGRLPLPPLKALGPPPPHTAF